jgi:hypothetical protein
MSESATSPVFIVTGARRGIGDAIVQELRKRSAHPSLLKPLRGCLKSPDSVIFTDYIPSFPLEAAGTNPDSCTVSLDLPGLFKHPLRS